MKSKRIRMTAAQLNRLNRLLFMEYKPSELAQEIGLNVNTIRSYIKAGCPFRRDETGHIWIVGTEFRDWAVQATARKRRPLSAGQAWCMHCRQPVEMTGSETIRPSNQYVEIVARRCAICDKPVYRTRRR